MALPGAVLFPHALMPLFIFEPRYRAMLAHALQGDRMFCVALMKPGVEEAISPRDFHETAGVGLVRACVGHDDGTSHLVLQGLARVRLESFVQEQPFRIARLGLAPETNRAAPEIGERQRELLELCARLPLPDPEARAKLGIQLAQIGDPVMLSDIIAHTFLRRPEHQQEVLAQADVVERLQILAVHLKAEWKNKA